jgi:hypothetical protein
MPMTEDELRAALRSRTDSAPATPGLAERAERAGRRQQTGARVAGAVALVAVMAVAAAAVLPRVTAQTPVPPATTSPSPSASESGLPTDGDRYEATATIDGLTTVAYGPKTVDGTGSFEVELTVENRSGSAWTGTVGIGVVATTAVPGWYDGAIFELAPDADLERAGNFGATLLQDDRQFQGVMFQDDASGRPITVGAGDSRTWKVALERNAGTAVLGPVTGWVAYVQKEGSGSTPVAVDSGYPVTVTPTTSNLPCATVSIGSFDKGTPGPWGLDYAATTTVGANGKATWTEVPGVDSGGGSNVDSTQGSDVRTTTVIRALADAGAGEATGYGAGRPDQPSSMAPGSYVAYSAVRTVEITFAGSCGPSGEPISGTWTTYADTTEAVLDCSTEPAAGTAEAKAKAYCPKD